MLQEKPVLSGSAVCKRSMRLQGNRPSFMRGQSYGFDLTPRGSVLVYFTEYAGGGGVPFRKEIFRQYFLPRGGVGMG